MSDEEKEVEEKNNPKTDRRSELYAEMDEKRAADPDYAEVADADHDKTVEIEEEDRPRDEHGRFVAKEEAQPPAKRKFKIMGKEVELTDEEIEERVSKSEAAEQKFQEAARLRKEAEEMAARASVKPAPESNVEEDDVALARAIQMGSEEEAVKAIKRLRTPSVKPDEIVRLVDSKLAFQDAKRQFLDEYKEEMADPVLQQIILDREQVLAIEGKPAGYQRMKEAGEFARKIKAKLTPDKSREQKLERKESLSANQVKPANVRQAPVQDEDKEESTHDTIANMAKARGQLARTVGNL